MKRTLIPLLAALLVLPACETEQKPNVILVMTDDQGWGETGYYNHPYLKTPNLDAMAANGLRFDRFYSGSPVCSPTRASVLTGRSNDRTNVHDHGFPLRIQENTAAEALKEEGYITAHFGKWHLSGYRGRGAPVIVEDVLNPVKFGFDSWLSATNYFDMDPVLGSSNGNFEEFQGGSSTILVKEALDFIRKEKNRDQPFFIVIWYGSPHVPSKASEEDRKAFIGLENSLQHHFGELVDVDNSIGDLRMGLKELGMSENTLLWFISDNGGHKQFGPDGVGGLRGYKKDLYEGGLRVPGIIEWPSVIKKPRVTKYPAVTMDIFPTIAEVLDLPESVMTHPIDGISLKKLFKTEVGSREKPIPFRYLGGGAMIDNNYKIIIPDIEKKEFELYDLVEDPREGTNLVNKESEIAHRMMDKFQAWNNSVEKSIEGRDYPGGLAEPDSGPKSWRRAPEYEPYLEILKKRPEFRKYWENQ